MLDHPHQKILVANCSKLSCLSACKKLTSSLTSSLTCCTEIANLLCWAILACLATHTHTHTQNDSITLKKLSTFASRQKNDFTLHIFLEILQRYCKLVVFSTLGMFSYAHPKWYYHLVEIHNSRPRILPDVVVEYQ